MTREEAKAILYQKIKPCVLGEWGEAIDMAIEALSANYTTVKPKDAVAEPTDLISRADAFEAVRNICNTPCNEYFVNALKQLPSAEAVKVAYICDGRKCDADCSDCFRTLDIEHAKDFKLIGSVYYQQESADRPSGEWIKHNDRSTIIVYYTCSECGEIENGTPPYCRKCGAKMGGEHND